MSIRLPKWPPDWPEIETAAVESIRSGQWGTYCSDANGRLAECLADRFQSSHVRLCCSGSAAIEIALRAAGVGPGDEVIVSAYDYPGNFRTIELLGGRPVLVDVAPRSVCLDHDQLEMAASDQVRAVIVSHLFGVAAEIERVREKCDDRGWVLIEDACQVPGMTINERPAGSFGHFGTLSFGGSKPLSSGSGGALLTSDPRLAARLGPLLDRPSEAMPLSPLQAAVLEPQLEKLQELNRHRAETTAFLEAEVVPQLQHWQWFSHLQSCVAASYYKVAWAARSAEHRRRIVQAAGELGLPIGEGFKAMSASRRCRKPVSLENATRLGEQVFVMDHTALLIDGNVRETLADGLCQLHRKTGEE